MENNTEDDIVKKLFVIASETGKSIDEVVMKAKQMLEEEKKKRSEEAEKIIIP